MITGQSSIDNGAVQQTSIPNLFVLLSGTKTPSPTELLSSKSMENLLRRCAELFDIIVIDSAPLFPVVDSHNLAALSDAVLLVVRSRVTPGPAVRSAIELTKQLKGRVTGIVLNDVDLTDFAQHYYHRYYSYGYGYASNPSQAEQQKRLKPEIHRIAPPVRVRRVESGNHELS